MPDWVVGAVFVVVAITVMAKAKGFFVKGIAAIATFCLGIYVFFSALSDWRVVLFLITVGALMIIYKAMSRAMKRKAKDQQR